MKVAQLLHTLTPGDAISGEANLLKNIFDNLKIANVIYASAVNENYLTAGVARVLPIADNPDFLFFHYSIGGLFDHYKEAKSRVKVLIFHNLTPPSFFERYNLTLVSSLNEGLKTLKEAVEISDVIICDSKFNLTELQEKVGASLSNKKIFVLGLAAPDTLLNAKNDFLTRIPRKFFSSKVRFLTVGRVAPNKNIEKVIEIFACYKHYVEGSSALAIVGTDTDCEIYRAELELAVNFFKVEDSVFFFGAVSDKVLKNLYKTASVYLCASLHEGFCVPLLEAFSFDLPVVAFRNGAIPETLGGAGICTQNDDTESVFKALYLLTNDVETRNMVISKQRSRLKEFSREKFQENFLEIWKQIAEL